VSLTPWRGPGPGRPDLPLPPDPMPLFRGGRLRKRWRYLGVFGPEVMLCAARVEIGPLRQSFWAIWDRERRRLHEQTRMLRTAAVKMDGQDVAIDTRGVGADLRVGEAAPVECFYPSGERAYTWTRKRAGVPVSGTIEAGGRSWSIAAEGVADESAGYHARHTSWRWSAGVGRAVDGRAVAWNLVRGLNDPERGSERAIWVDGTPGEPAPVCFSELESIEFAGGPRLDFAVESERARDDNLLALRSRYRHRFGTFSGSLDGLGLAEAFGVMEEHEAVW
jgi:Protein of unknown function (DUF2804)